MASSFSNLDDGVVVVGAASHPLRDAYHSILRMRWGPALGVIAALFLLANGVFGLLFTLVGGVTNARDGSFRDAFFFSVQTMGTKTSKTKEGVTFYRLCDLTLTRDRALALSRSWTVIHVIDEKSPLHGLTPEDCVKDEVEIMASVVGTDDTSLQPVHGRNRWEAKDIAWGRRLADVLSELPDGRLQLDVRKFDVTVATQPTEGFPYPRAT